jgi:hypothetical protein
MSFTQALQHTNLSDMQKTILNSRFVKVVTSFERRCNMLSVLFHGSRFTVTVGSLIVPALLSIQYTSTTSSSNTNTSDPESFAYRIYWATWVISLLVTTSNGLSNIFKIDKKYYFLHTTLEQLRSEGWQYFELSGRYSGFFTPNEVPTHANQFVFFCHTVEKIKMKQVEEEYYKLLDNHAGNTHTQTNTTTGSTTTNDTSSGPSIIPPTPLKNMLEQAANLPPELLKQLKTISAEDVIPTALTKVVTESAEDDKKSISSADDSASKDAEEAAK